MFHGSAHPSLPDDFWVRATLSPVFGAIVPSVSGLVDHGRHSSGSLVLSYVAFSVIAFLVWEGNRRLQARLQRRDEWLERPWRRAGVLLGSIVLFTIPFSATLLLAWRWITGDHGTRPFALFTALLAIVAIVAVITNVYETLFVLRDWESARLRSARAEAARLSAEMDRLVRDVDPHFLFNNLHALGHLVEQKDPRAPAFVQALGDTYRYLLATRRRPLVSLEDELGTLHRHRALAAARYGDGIRLEVSVPPERAARLLLPPVTLGELLTNAVKHNDTTSPGGMTLRVSLEGEHLVVSNRMTPHRSHASTGTGLANLAARHRLATGREVTWGAEDGHFVVRIPLQPAA
jgi:hypothetical protein